MARVHRSRWRAVGNHGLVADPTAGGDRPSAGVLEVAERLFVAIENGDIESARALYHPAAEIWHNTDGVVQGVEQNVATLRWMLANLTAVTYVDVRRSTTSDGFVQRHVLVATNRAGQQVQVAACIVATVRDGLITRLDEYLDSAAVARILER